MLCFGDASVEKDFSIYMLANSRDRPVSLATESGHWTEL